MPEVQERREQFCSELPGLTSSIATPCSRFSYLERSIRTKEKRGAVMTHAALHGESLMSAEVQRIGFGGGCHWCTEAVFAALRGIIRVEQGFIRADAPDDNFSEGVLLTFQPDTISLGSLIEIHLRTHSSTSNHFMRRKYRSAVYVKDEVQAEVARRVLMEVGPGFDAPLVTRILPFRAFKASDERFQRYAEKNAGGPFCTTYIDPKLALLRKEFGGLLR